MTYYGGEEAYQRQLAIQGISEEAYDHIRETAYLYQRLQDAFCTEGSALYPDGAALAQYAADNNYLTGRVVFVPAGDGAEDEANGYLKRLQEAEDKLAEHAAICQEREVDQGYYIFLKEDTDLSAVLPAYFSSLLADRRATANVVFNEDLYSTIDTGAFYEKLVALRSEAAQEPAQAQQ